MNVKKLKEACGFEISPVRTACSNCAAFASDFAYPSWCRTEEERIEFDEKGYAKNEKNLRCADHGFAVKKHSLCKQWRLRTDAAAEA